MKNFLNPDYLVTSDVSVPIYKHFITDSILNTYLDIFLL